MRRDLDDVIQGWPYDPEPGEVLAREVRARDGRTVLQVRDRAGRAAARGRRPTRRRAAPRVRHLSRLPAALRRRPGPVVGRQVAAMDDVGVAVRRGRPRVRPVQPPSRRLAGPAAVRQGHPGRRPHAGPDGLHPAPRQRGDVHRLARAAPRARAVPPHPGRHHPGPGAPPLRGRHRRPARRDRPAQRPPARLVGPARPRRIPQPRPGRSPPQLRAGDPQQLPGREDPARAARRGRRPRGLRAGRPPPRPDQGPGPRRR